MNKPPVIVKVTVPVSSAQFEVDMEDSDLWIDHTDYIDAVRRALISDGRFGDKQIGLATSDVQAVRNPSNKVNLARAGRVVSPKLGNAPVVHVITKVIVVPVVVLRKPQPIPVVDAPAKLSKEDLYLQHLVARRADKEALFLKTEANRQAREAKRAAAQCQGLFDIFESEVAAA
jgi:hypothetical protein